MSVIGDSHHSNHRNIKFFPSFCNYPLEHKFQKFIVSLFYTARCAEWTLLKSIGDSVTYDRIAWKISWAIFKNTIGFRCNKYKIHKLWTFLIKVFHQALPLRKTLKQRKSRLYRSLKCSSCRSN